MVRILFQNVGGVGFMSGDITQESVKIEKLKKLIIGKSIDIVGLAEVNKDWRCVDTEHDKCVNHMPNTLGIEPNTF